MSLQSGFPGGPGTSESGATHQLYDTLRAFLASGDAAQFFTSALFKQYLDKAGVQLTQPGDIKLLGYGTPPSGWLMCDGSKFAPSVYPLLFSAIGTKFGGDGVTFFKVPDLRERFPLGITTASELGSLGGENTHTLTVAEMPVHSHSIIDGGHVHTAVGGVSYMLTTGATNTAAGANQFGLTSSALSTASATTGISVQNQGSGGAHNNMPPFQYVNFVIYTGT